MTWHSTQNNEYLELCRNRVNQNVVLTWVNQFLDLLVEIYGDHLNGKSVNDVGCNLLQFYKGLKERKLDVTYRGYDIESIYLQNGGGIVS